MPKVYDYKMEGLKEVLSNLNKEVEGIKNRTKEGTYKAGLIVQRESQKRVPVDTSNLKNSAATTPIKGDNGPAVAVHYGIGADYAIHVHERTELNHPVGEAKFLENALKVKEKEVLKTIQEEARIKGR